MRKPVLYWTGPLTDPSPSVPKWLYLLIPLSILLAALIVVHWMNMARDGRRQIVETLALHQNFTREQLARHWRGNVRWTPALKKPAHGSGHDPANAETTGAANWPTVRHALAATPRSVRHDFDVIFTAFDGDRVIGVLALVSVGGWYNESRINLKRHPTMMIERPLNAEEIEGLERMVELLEQHRDQYDPREDRYAWTNNVLQDARHLYKLQTATTTDPVGVQSQPSE